MRQAPPTQSSERFEEIKTRLVQVRLLQRFGSHSERDRSQLEADLKDLECFMYDNILDLRCRYKSRSGAKPVHGRRSRGLNS